MDDYAKSLIAQRDALLREIAESEAGILPSGVPLTTTPETLAIMRAELGRLEALVATENRDA